MVQQRQERQKIWRRNHSDANSNSPTWCYYAQISLKLLAIFCIWQSPWWWEGNNAAPTKVLMLFSELGIASKPWVSSNFSCGPEHGPWAVKVWLGTFHSGSFPALLFLPKCASLKFSAVFVCGAAEPLEMGQWAEQGYFKWVIDEHHYNAITAQLKYLEAMHGFASEETTVRIEKRH